MRQHLERALSFRQEKGVYDLDNIDPIILDPVENTSFHTQEKGISVAVIQMASFFLQLLKSDKAAAIAEFSSWPTDDNIIFARLRIWASGEHSIISNDEFGDFITSLNDMVFWDYFHQRDLLIVLQKRWKDLNELSHQLIEKKLISDPAKEQDEKCAYRILERAVWLQNNVSGCVFSIAAQEKITQLKAVLGSDWTDDYAKKAAASRGSFSGFIETDPRCEELLNSPLSSILSLAEKLRGLSDNFFVHREPYAGFVAHCPVRAFAALTYGMKQEPPKEWAWSIFLKAEQRKNDKKKFVCLIAQRLTRYSNDQLACIIDSVIRWLEVVSKKRDIQCLPFFDRILERMINFLRDRPLKGGSTILFNNSHEIDWERSSINSPAGKTVEILFNYPEIKCEKKLSNQWLSYAKALLSLPDDLRRYVLVLFFQKINFLFDNNSEWTEENLLPALQGNDSSAAWSGFLGQEYFYPELFMKIKNNLIDFINNSSLTAPSLSKRSAPIIVSGWRKVHNNEYCISDDEMRKLLRDGGEEFRVSILDTYCVFLQKGESERYKEEILRLFDILPLNISAKSSKVLFYLCRLLFLSKELFPDFYERILSYLDKIDDEIYMQNLVNFVKDSLVRDHWEKIVNIFCVILPDDASRWPYKIGNIIETIKENNSTSDKSYTLSLLIKRWNAR